MRDDRIPATRVYPGTRAHVLCSTVGMSRTDWLARRREIIGGSDISAVMGLNPWRSALAVYCDKTGITQDDEATERMRWGTILEDAIANEWAERQRGVDSMMEGAHIQRINAILVHPEHKVFGANVDRLIVGPHNSNGILEVKNVSHFSGSAWDGDEVPDHYAMQMQWYLGVTGLSWGVFAALVGGQRLVSKVMHRDDELIRLMFDAADRFWTDHVLAGIPPAPDGSESSRDAIRTMYPDSNGESIMLMPDVEPLIREFREADAACKQAEERKDAAKAALCAVLGDAERGIYDGVTVSWKSQTRETFDSKRFKADHADLAAQYMKSSTTRVFTLKETK